MTVFLIGYMASGKTTLGRALAKAVGYDFIDLDFYITQRFRKSIPDIFSEKGEAEFRRLESAMLREAGEFENTVISCGGGTPCFSGNMEYMNTRGLTLLLEASVERTVRRLLCASTRRPITEGKTAGELPAFIKAHMAERAPHYGKALFRIDSTELESKEKIAEKVAEARKLLKI